MINDQSNVCNVQQAVLNMGNNPALFKKHFNRFKDSSGEIFDQLNTLISGRHYYDTAVLCHSMKGLSSMLCFTALQFHMSEAEALFKSIAPAESTNGHTIEHTTESIDEHTIENIDSLMTFIRQDIQAICGLEI